MSDNDPFDGAELRQIPLYVYVDGKGKLALSEVIPTYHRVIGVVKMLVKK